MRVTDTQIANLVGLATYKALYLKWPKLYIHIDHPMDATIAHRQLIEGIISSSTLSYNEVGEEVRRDLIRMVNTGADILGVASSLVRSSPPVDYYSESPGMNLICFLFLIIWSLIVCMVLWRVGFVHAILNPGFREYGLGLSLLLPSF